MIVVFCFCPKPVQAVSLEWERNSEPTVVGYHLFFGRQSRVYDSIIDVGNMTLAQIPPLQNGQTYYFAVTAYDSQGLESELSEEVSYTPLSVNSAPVARADVYALIRNTSLTVASGGGVLANDSDADHDALSTILVSGTANGTLSLNVNGAFTYSPITGFVGTDRFTYRATDGHGTSAVVTATLTVSTLPNSVPVARADSYATDKNVTLTVAPSGLLGNDSDGDGDALTAVLVAAPAHGQLALSASGGFTYAPAVDFSGSDSFTYLATDGRASSAVALVTIRVTGGGGPPANSAPVASSDTYFTLRNQELVITPAMGVLANDSDADHDALAAQVVAPPAHGELVLMANGAFVYRPATNYAGADQFSYRTTDGKTNSQVANVLISVAEESECSECLVSLRLFLASRSNVLAEIIAPAAAVPTNSTCLEMELSSFYALARKIRVSADAELSAAMESTVQCLTLQVRQSLAKRSMQVGGLLKSTWSDNASNRLEQTRKKLDQMELVADPLSGARTLLKSMASLRQVDRYVQSGSVAPVAMANETILCKFVYDGHSFSGRFQFGETGFIFQSDASGIPQSGNYSFTRTAWNSGLLNFTLEGPLDISMPLKFIRTGGKISGPNIRGSFLME